MTLYLVGGLAGLACLVAAGALFTRWAVAVAESVADEVRERIGGRRR